MICKVCGQRVALNEHKDHAQSGCTTVAQQPTTVNHVLSKAKDSPLSPLEEKLKSSLVKRSLLLSKSDTLQVKTGGQVSFLYKHKHTHQV